MSEYVSVDGEEGVDELGTPDVEDLLKAAVVEVELSLTLSKRQGHVPPAWASVLYNWMVASDTCTAGAVTLERGGKMQHLHCQGILRVKIDPNKIEALKAELKTLVGWRRGDGSGTFVNLKEFGAGQVFALHT